MIDFTYLRTFLAIYRTSSLTRASKVVALTQPAVSQHLKALEAIAGRALFTRTARGVVPTLAGHDLAERVSPLLDALEVEGSLLSPGASARGTLHVGGPIDFLASRVVPALAASPRLEAVRIVVFPGATGDLVERIQRLELDVIVTGLRVPHDLHRVALTSAEEVLVVGPARAEELRSLRGVKARLLALRDGPFVAFTAAMPVLRQIFEPHVSGPLPTPQTVFPNYTGMVRAVIAGRGVSVVPRYVAAPYLARGELYAVTARASEHGLSLVCRRSYARTPMFRLELGRAEPGAPEGVVEAAGDDARDPPRLKTRAAGEDVALGAAP